MTLTRIPGELLRADTVSLSIPWAATRSDPNEYYLWLGLDPNSCVLMCHIKDAWRSICRESHPDGSYPDLDRFDRVQVAYEVLGNPVLRVAYDSLLPDQRWPDKYVLKAIQDHVSAAATTGIMEKLFGTSNKDIEDRVSVEEDPIVVNNDAILEDDLQGLWSIYYYEEEGPPNMSQWSDWSDQIRTWLRLLGSYKGVRLGVTNQNTHILDRDVGGRILMANGSVDPLLSLLFVCSEISSN